MVPNGYRTVRSKLVIALAGSIVISCSGPSAPQDPTPPPPPTSSSDRAAKEVEPLRPKVLAALTKAAQPLGPITAPEDGTNDEDDFSSSVEFCQPVVGFNTDYGLDSFVGIDARLIQKTSAGEGGDGRPGVRAEIEVAYDARREDMGEDTGSEPRCTGGTTLLPASIRGYEFPGTTHPLTQQVSFSQRVASAVVAGRNVQVIRTELRLPQDDLYSYPFLQGQVRMTLLYNRWFLNIAVLQARPADPSEAVELTDEAQQTAITLAETLVAELPP